MTLKVRRRDSCVTTRIMRAVKSKDSKAERSLAKEMWAVGLRYRKHPKGIIGKPDFAFLVPRIVIFVDGDFWHGFGWEQRGFKSFEAQFTGLHNSDFWKNKILRNMTRDKLVNETLRDQGWFVIRCLESDLLKDKMPRYLDDIKSAVKIRGLSGSRRDSKKR